MNVLSLDLGTHMGWSISKDKEILDSGHIKWSSPVGHGSYNSLSDWLVFIDAKWSPSLVVIEKPNTFGPGYHAKRVLFGMLAIVNMFFKDDNIIMVSATSIKKMVTGSGKATKEMMVSHIREFGHNIKSNDEADAIGMGYFYWEMLHEQ